MRCGRTNHRVGALGLVRDCWPSWYLFLLAVTLWILLLFLLPLPSPHFMLGWLGGAYVGMI